MSGLHFGKSRIIKGHSLSLGARLQAARGTPQAVVKVISYGHGAKAVSQSIDYISREGELPLETESGDIVLGRAEQKELVKNWSRDFGSRKGSRDSVHLAFSMPKGSDPEKLRGAVRTVLGRHFPGQEAVFAIHTDRPHPHAHVVIKMRSRETGKQLRLNMPEIHKLREAFAKAACEQGVELAASPRAARGVGKKSTGQAIHHMRQRGITPRVERQAVDEIISEFERGLTGEKPWEVAMRERNQKERKAYREEAEQLRAVATQQKIAQDQATRQALLKAAADLERFSKDMPEPKTRRQALLAWASKQFGFQRSRPRPNRDSGMER